MCSKGKMLLMIMMAVKVTKMGKLLFGDKFSIFIRVCGDLKRTGCWLPLMLMPTMTMMLLRMVMMILVMVMSVMIIIKIIFDIDVDDDEKGRNSARRAKLKIMAVCSAPRVDPGK